MIQHLNQTTFFFSSSNSLQNFVAMNTRQQPICLSGDHLSFLKPCLQWPKEPNGHPTFDPSAACPCARGDFGRVEVAADRRDQLGDLCPPSVTLVVLGPGAAMAHGPGAGPNQAGPWNGGACWGSVDRELFWNGQNGQKSFASMWSMCLVSLVFSVSFLVFHIWISEHVIMSRATAAFFLEESPPTSQWSRPTFVPQACQEQLEGTECHPRPCHNLWSERQILHKHTHTNHNKNTRKQFYIANISTLNTIKETLEHAMNQWLAPLQPGHRNEYVRRCGRLASTLEPNQEDVDRHIDLNRTHPFRVPAHGFF